LTALKTDLFIGNEWRKSAAGECVRAGHDLVAHFLGGRSMNFATSVKRRSVHSC